MRRVGKKIHIGRLIEHIILITVGFFWVYPFLWMISASFKEKQDFFSDKLSLIPHHFTFDNIIRVWTQGQFGQYFLNSVIITVCSVLLVLTMTNMSGYVLGRYQFVGRKAIMGVFVASISIPLVSTIIPVFEVIKKMNLVGTRLGVILSGAGGGHVIFLLLFSSYYKQISNEIEDAGRIDGAGFIKMYARIMMPLSKPVMSTVIIMESIWNWNSFLLPLVLTLNNPKARTLAVGLYAFKGENTVDWTGIAAGGVISVIPIVILFFLMQQYFVDGVAGAVKS